MFDLTSSYAPAYLIGAACLAAAIENGATNHLRGYVAWHFRWV